MRLLRGEIAQLGEFERVTETIQFGALPHEQLTYSLEVSSNAKEINARYTNNKITVTIPEPAARNWIATEQVALENSQPIENAIQNGKRQKDAPQNILKILIEKDFVCLDRKDDPDNLDAFPHPTRKCG